MNLTLNFYLKNKRLKFFNLKPTQYFFKWYLINYRVIPALSSQKLPKINRLVLVKLL